MRSRSSEILTLESHSEVPVLIKWIHVTLIAAYHFSRHRLDALATLIFDSDFNMLSLSIPACPLEQWFASQMRTWSWRETCRTFANWRLSRAEGGETLSLARLGMWLFLQTMNDLASHRFPFLFRFSDRQNWVRIFFLHNCSDDHNYPWNKEWINDNRIQETRRV